MLRAQGEGIWIVLLELGPKAFVSGMLGAAGIDAWKRLKALMDELQEALGQPKGSHGQLYVRPDVVSDEEWEASARKGPMPGSPSKAQSISSFRSTPCGATTTTARSSRRTERRAPPMAETVSGLDYRALDTGVAGSSGRLRRVGRGGRKTWPPSAPGREHRPISGADIPEFIPLGFAIYIGTKIADKTLDSLLDLLKRLIIDRARTRWWTRGKRVKGVIYGPNNEILREVTWVSKDGERQDREAGD